MLTISASRLLLCRYYFCFDLHAVYSTVLGIYRIYRIIYHINFSGKLLGGKNKNKNKKTKHKRIVHFLFRTVVMYSYSDISQIRLLHTRQNVQKQIVLFP